MEEHLEHREEQKPEGGPSWDRAALLAALAAVVAAIIGSLTLWFLGRSLRELEAIAALMLLGCGLLFDFRVGIHLKLGYLWFKGNVEKGWTKAKRRRLCFLTISNIALSLTATVAGVYYLQHPGRFWQLGVTLVLMILIGGLIESTRRLIEEGGPKCGADVIENCGPVAAFLHPDRSWNGKWGVDSGVRVISNKIPIGKRNKAAVLLILGLMFSLLTQTGVVVGRMVKGSDPPPSGNHAPRQHNQKGSSLAASGTDEEDSPEKASGGNPCGTEVTPGDGAPEPLRAEIRRVWEEKAPASGCARRAQPNPSESAYIVEGECQGLPWSLGIASWDRGTAVLLEAASAAARRIGRHQELIGASDRIDLAGGDFHVVHTPIGPYLLVREHKTDGEGGLTKLPESCADIERGKEGYLILSPGMAELWVRFGAEVAATWPALSGDGSEFSFQGIDDEPLAWGSCKSPVACEVHGSGVEMESSPTGIQQVTVVTVLETGPSW
ncbi:MAG: hypothetical protein M3Y75_13605 [Actinomycetota bacterium]|nr:hypothetical protein [Actinomycetota bacterium]